MISRSGSSRLNQGNLIAALVACLLTVSPLAAEPFRRGDRVVFIGDSITHNGLYHSYIYLFYQTRYPKRPIEVLNAGVSNGRVTDATARLQEDILDREPDAVVIDLGMNDVGTSHYTEQPAERRRATTVELLDIYREKMREILGRIRGHNKNIRIILLSPSPYDQSGNQERQSALGKDDALGKVTRILGKLADEMAVEFVDLHTPMVAANREGQLRRADFTVVGQDRVHPGPMGHLMMAYHLLSAQGVDGLVSQIVLSVNNESPRLLESRRAKVSGLSADNDTLQFKVLADSLPYPIENIPRKSGEAAAIAALDWIPFQEKLNREILRVEGLSPGLYRLRIDDLVVGDYSWSELAAGINLAGNRSTPQYRQAMEVATLNEERWNMERPLRGPAWVKYKVVWEGGVDPGRAEDYIQRWRNGDAHREYRAEYDEHFLEFSRRGAYERRWSEIGKLLQRIYQKSQPRELTYALSPIPSAVDP